MTKLTPQQEEALTQAVFNDPRVKAATKALYEVRHCSEIADTPSHKAVHLNLDKAIQDAVTKNDKYGMTPKEEKRYADLWAEMAQEGMDSYSCKPAPTGYAAEKRQR